MITNYKDLATIFCPDGGSLLLTQGLLGPRNEPVGGGAGESVLNVYRGSLCPTLRRSFTAVGYAMHSEYVPIIRDHLMGLRRVALFADHKRLRNTVIIGSVALLNLRFL